MLMSILELMKALSQYEIQSNFGGDIQFSHIEVLSDKQTYFEADTLYLGYISQLQNTHGSASGNTFLMIEDMDINLHIFEEQYKIVLLKTREGLENVLQKARAFVQDCSKREGRRLQILQLGIQNLSYQQLANALANIMNNPIAFSDVSFKTIAYSNNMQIDDYIWNEYTTKDYMPYEYLNIVKETGLGGVFAGDGPVWSTGSADVVPHRRLGCKIVSSNAMVGWVTMIEYNEIISEKDKPLLKLISQLLAAEFKKDPTYGLSRGKNFEYIITDILNSNMSNPFVFNEKIKQLSFPPNENFYVMAIKFVESKRHLMLVICKEIEAILTKSRAAIYGEGAVVIFTRKNRYPINETEMEALKGYLVKNGLIAGLSQCFYDLVDLRKFYDQAAKAIDLGSYLQPHECYFPYDDLCIYHMFDEIQSKQSLEDYIDTHLKALLKYDAENNTDYVRTVQTYLNCGQNYIEAAKALSIHRNTMVYRKGKIEEIIDANIDDPENCFRLRLSFKLLHYIRKNQNPIQ